MCLLFQFSKISKPVIILVINTWHCYLHCWHCSRIFWLLLFNVGCFFFFPKRVARHYIYAQNQVLVYCSWLICHEISLAASQVFSSVSTLERVQQTSVAFTVIQSNVSLHWRLLFNWVSLWAGSTDLFCLTVKALMIFLIQQHSA